MIGSVHLHLNMALNGSMCFFGAKEILLKLLEHAHFGHGTLLGFHELVILKFKVNRIDVYVLEELLILRSGGGICKETLI